jgi:hypothetical protein
MERTIYGLVTERPLLDRVLTQKNPINSRVPYFLNLPNSL